MRRLIEGANDDGLSIAQLKAELPEKDRVISALRSEIRELHHKHKRKPALKIVPSPEEDARLPTNTRPHVPREFNGDIHSATTAQLAKHRRKTMEACGCRLCALCLNPPLTFEEAEWFGYPSEGLRGLAADMGWAYEDPRPNGVLTVVRKDR